MTHCLLKLFVFIYSPRPPLGRAAGNTEAAIYTDGVQLGEGVLGIGGEIIFSPLLAEEKRHVEQVLAWKWCGSGFSGCPGLLASIPCPTQHGPEGGNI